MMQKGGLPPSFFKEWEPASLLEFILTGRDGKKDGHSDVLLVPAGAIVISENKDPLHIAGFLL